MHCSLSDSSVPGILQARALECVAVPLFRAFPNLGIKPGSSALQADSLPSEPPGKPNLYHGIKQFLKMHSIKYYILEI